MNLYNPVSTIMTPNPITISPEETLQVAHEIFDKFHIHHIPVVYEGELVGILSKSDFSFFKKGFEEEGFDMAFLDVKLNNYKVKSLMTKGVGRLEGDDRITVAIEIFKLNQFHALPVVDSNKRVIGIVTTLDIIKLIDKDSKELSSY